MTAADATPPGATPADTPVDTRRALLLLGVAVLAVSTSAVLATWLLGDPPDPARGISVALWRCLGGAVALAVAAHGRSVRLSPRQWRWLGASGALLGLHFALFHLSLAYTSVAAVTTLVTVMPIFVAMGAWAWLGEPASRTTLVGMAVTVVAGIALTAADVVASLRPSALRGDLLALAAAIVIAGSLLIARRERGGVPAGQYSAVVFGTAAVALLVLALVTGAPLAPWRGLEWLAIAGMVVGPQLLGHFLLQTVLADLEPTVVSTAILAEPVLGSLLAWWVLGQVPPVGLLVTGPLVLLGVGIAARGSVRTRHGQPSDPLLPGPAGAATLQSEKS